MSYERVSRIYLEGSLLRAQVMLAKGEHPEDIMLWLNTRLEGWIEVMLGNDQPSHVRKELEAL
jgi:hypothetical protein